MPETATVVGSYYHSQILMQCAQIIGQNVWSGGERVGAGFDAQTLELPEQRVPMQAEDPGGLGLIPLDFLQDIQDVLLLEVVPGLAQAQP